jgi:hypothetical protein
MPLSDLCQLDLRDLLRLVNVLQTCQGMLSGGFDGVNHSTMAVAAAAEYLCEWPVKFFGLLENLRTFHIDNGCTIRELYSPMYSAFLRRRYNGESDRFDFLRLAFLEFISNHVDRKAADVRVMRSFGFQVQRRFVTRAELSRRLDIDPRTVARSIPSDGREEKDHKAGQSIDLTHFEWKGTQPGKILGLRAAAKELGIPAQVLRALRNCGGFQVRNLSAGHQGFHERDLEAFKERLLNGIDRHEPCEGMEPEKVASLGAVLRHRRHGTDDKVALIEGILNGDVKGTRGEADSILNIHLPTIILQQFWQYRCATVHGAVLTGADAAKRIGCSYEVLKGLINAGKLAARKSGSSWLIEIETVIKFCADFMPTSLLAEMNFTSPRRIKQVCVRNGIPLLEVSLRERRAKLFLLSTESERISALLGCKRPVRMISVDKVKSIAG